jgi:hypothetical protein
MRATLIGCPDLHPDCRVISRHVLVESVVCWRRLGGLLWWQRWVEPEQTALASLVLQGRFDEWFIHPGAELAAAGRVGANVP